MTADQCYLDGWVILQSTEAGISVMHYSSLNAQLSKRRYVETYRTFTEPCTYVLDQFMSIIFAWAKIGLLVSVNASLYLC